MIKKLSIALISLLLFQFATTGLRSSVSRAAATHAAYLHAFCPSKIKYEPALNKYIDQLDSLSFAWSCLDFSNTVSINSTEGMNDNTSFYYPSDYADFVRYAKSKGKPVQLSIYSDSLTARKVLTDEAAVKKLVDLLAEKATQNIFGSEKIIPDVSPNNTAPSTDTSPDPASTGDQVITPASISTDVATASAVEAAGTVIPGTGTQTTRSASSGSINTPNSPNAPENGTCFFDGLVIDFEGLRNTNSDGTPNEFNGKPISQYFTQFLKELSARLKPENKKLFVAVNPEEYYDGYDYKAIATIADRVILMAHDYEPTTSLKKYELDQYYEYDVLVPTKSPAPSNDVKNAVNTVKSRIGDMNLCKKVILQLAFDTAQWQFPLDDPNGWEKLDRETVSTEEKTTPTYEMIKSRMDNTDGLAVNITYGYNNLLECPYMSYYNPTDSLFNFIVYENSKSMASKISIASAAGLGGISLWALGNISDYKDKTGVSHNLNTWDKILEQVNSKTIWSMTAKPAGKVVRFADKKLETYVRKVLGKPSGSLYEGDLLEINRLKLPKNTATRPTDLKYMKNLEFLDASENNIKDLSFLGSLPSLKALYLAKNQIKDLKPLVKLTGLEVLSLNNNNITDLSPLSGLIKLKRLYLSENRISSVKPLVKLKNLQSLYLENNNIKDIGLLQSFTYSIVL